MKLKFTGDQDSMTLRGITFDKGKAVEVEEGEFLTRLLNLDYFAEVKTRKPRKNDKDST